jgi:hypothetical protein
MQTVSAAPTSSPVTEAATKENLGVNFTAALQDNREGESPLNFRAFDKNGDGFIDRKSEFIPHLKYLIKQYDKNNDGYISDGKGKYLFGTPEDGVDELAAFQQSGIPFDKTKVGNDTWRGDGYSFYYSNDNAHSIFDAAWGTIQDSNSYYGNISLKWAADKNGWIQVSDGDRKLLGKDGIWDRYAKSARFPDGDSSRYRLSKYDGSFKAFLNTFNKSTAPGGTGIEGSFAADEDVLTPAAQYKLEEETRAGSASGIRFYNRDSSGERIMTGPNGTWGPAADMRISSIASNNFKITKPGTQEEMTEWSFRDLVGYP